MSDKSIQQVFLDKVVDKSKEEKDAALTGEKNLTIKKLDLVEKVNKINRGYLEVIEKEHRIFERQGLINGYVKDRIAYYDIPDWDNFISAVKSFYDVCYAGGDD